MRNKKKLSIILIIILVLAAAGAGYWFFTKDSAEDNNGNSVVQRDNAPTQEEQEAGDKIKPGLEDGNNPTPIPTPPTSGVSVVVTSATFADGAADITSYTPHYEDGNCTFTFTKDGQTVTRQTNAERDATTTICTNPLVEASAFPSGGEWTFTASYANASGSVKGASEQKTISITK